MKLQPKDFANASPSERSVSKGLLQPMANRASITLSCHFTLPLEITLVSYDNHWEVVLVLHAQDLLLECGDFLETLSACDGVDQQKSFAGAHVLLSHGRVLFLAGGIEDIEKCDLIVDNALLAVRV